MEITVAMFLFLLLMAFACEFIDSSFGMGYGTILTPVLLIMGFDPLIGVPAVLLSQAFGGFFASLFHHQFKNVSFSASSRELKIVLIISGFGILATIFGAIVAINISKAMLNTYIGLLVAIMGIIVLLNKAFAFSWKKMIGVGLVSAFNKGISGGGFGPIVTAGQILSGQGHKAAIGVTTLAEAPICISAFFTYLIGRTITELPASIMDMPVSEFFQGMFSSKILSWELTLALFLGATLVAPFGAFTTKVISKEKIHYIVGVMITVLGLWTLYKTWF